jgi:hypothetical protein
LKKERHLAQAAKWGSEGEKTIKKAEIAEKRRLKEHSENNLIEKTISIQKFSQIIWFLRG